VGTPYVLVLLRKCENGRSTVEGVKIAMEALKAALPPGVTITPCYDRTELIDAAMWTVEKALGAAVLLVLLVLIVLLGNLRAALTVALILPLSVLATLFLMRVFGVTAILMSLGVSPSPSVSWWTRPWWWSRTCTPSWRARRRAWTACTSSTARPSKSRRQSWPAC
jgi:hypothetical protein